VTSDMRRHRKTLINLLTFRQVTSERHLITIPSKSKATQNFIIQYTASKLIQLSASQVLTINSH